MKVTLHADGGARGNPGPAGIGVVLRDERGEVLGEIARGIGMATNNVAEYTALIEGLKLAAEVGATHVDVHMDSVLVVAQVKGDWKIKSDSLRPLAVEARRLLERFEGFELIHVPRAHNADADRLANQAMDAAALDSEPGPEWEPPQGSLLE